MFRVNIGGGGSHFAVLPRTLGTGVLEMVIIETPSSDDPYRIDLSSISSYSFGVVKGTWEYVRGPLYIGIPLLLCVTV